MGNYHDMSTVKVGLDHFVYLRAAMVVARSESAE